MKIIIQNKHIVAAVSDDYTGPEEFADAPADFDITRLSDYVLRDDVWVITPPSTITPRQARILLASTPATDEVSIHLLEQVENIFNTLEEPQRTIAKISWDYATEIQRRDPLIKQVQDLLELSDGDIDKMFLNASVL